jgi:hypothetical protein
MFGAQPRRDFHRKPTEDRWPGLLVSCGATLALFAAAFGAMRSVPSWIDRDRAARPDPAILLELPRPAAVPSPPRVVPRAPRVPSPARSDRAAPPSAPVGVQSPASAVVSAPPTPAPHLSQRDSASAVTSATDAAKPASAPRGQATTRNSAGAPTAAAGVTIHADSITTEMRDSIAKAKARAFAAMAAADLPKGAELQTLQQSQRQAALLHRRLTTAGNSRDLVVLQGAGVGGVGAVGGATGVGSLALPLFSSGPSASERRKNEKLDADYQLRLRRLQDRVLQRHDSVRADSLRRDSLARRAKPIP